MAPQPLDWPASGRKNCPQIVIFGLRFVTPLPRISADGPFSDRHSLDESMGEIWFWQVAEVVIEGGFVGFLRSKTVRFSGDQF